MKWGVSTLKSPDKLQSQGKGLHPFIKRQAGNQEDIFGLSGLAGVAYLTLCKESGSSIESKCLAWCLGVGWLHVLPF